MFFKHNSNQLPQETLDTLNRIIDLVADHRLDEDEAREVAIDLTYRLVRRAYKLDGSTHRAGAARHHVNQEQERGFT